MKRILIIATLCALVSNVFAEELYTVCLPVAVSVYENAITDAKVIGSLAPKQEVEVYVVNGDWAIIKFNNGVGYVAAACLKKSESKPAEEQQTQPTEQQPAQPVVEQPVVQQPVQPKEDKKQAETTRPASTLTTKNMSLSQTEIYNPYETYRLTSKTNRVADILRCKSNMYITFDYQLSMLSDPYMTPFYNNFQDKVNIHLGAFNFGGIVRLWGPIGLDMGFGLGVGAGKYDQPAAGYERTIRFKLDYNLYLRPVFWVNVTNDISLHLLTGPRFDLVFLEEDFSYNAAGKRDFGGDVEYADIVEKGRPYRSLEIPWGLGLGFNYKHIGLRLIYEWELYGGFTDKFVQEKMIDRTLCDAKHNAFTLQLYIPLLF